MKTDRELMQQALEALVWEAEGWEDVPPITRDAITALRAALAEPEQEPVAWLFQHEETGLTECVDTQQVDWGFEKNNPRWQKIAPLYTTPPQRKPLTDEEIDALVVQELGLDADADAMNEFARAIEAKLKEKNT